MKPGPAAVHLKELAGEKIRKSRRGSQLLCGSCIVLLRGAPIEVLRGVFRGLAEVENCLLMGARATAGNCVISGLRI